MLSSPLWGIKTATAIDLNSIEPHRSHFNDFPSIEGEVFVVGDVAELVAEAAGGADGLVDVAVGVAVDPVVDAAGDNHHDGLVVVARCEVDVRDLRCEHQAPGLCIQNY